MRAGNVYLSVALGKYEIVGNLSVLTIFPIIFYLF